MKKTNNLTRFERDTVARVVEAALQAPDMPVADVLDPDRHEKQALSRALRKLLEHEKWTGTNPPGDQT